MTIFIKNFGILICTIYYYVKLLNIHLNTKKKIVMSFYVVVLATLSTYLDSSFIFPSIIIVIFSLILFLAWSCNMKISTSITTVTLALSISYVLLAVTSAIVGAVAISLFETPTHIILQILCLLLQIFLMRLPFKFDRFKNGMPFLKKDIHAILGLIISIVIISLSVFISYHNYKYNLLPLFCILLLLSLLIYYYWRNSLTKTYMDKLKDRDILNLNQLIAQQSEEIIRLKEENRQLSKIVHKDNKLIPTLEHSVHTFITNNSITDHNILWEGNQIIERLSKLSKERRELIQKQDTLCQKLTLTNVLSIDQYLKYFQSEVVKNGIGFQTNIDCNVPYLIENIIEEYDLETLIQDLLDDAYHATQANNGRYILLSIGIVSNVYTISIYDSGVPFTTEVLCKWGLEQITTRHKDGGSGIGMLNTYETLQKYNASFIIRELGTESHKFTKEVTISFNNKNQYILQTNRSEEELIILTQRPDLQIIGQ